MASTTDVDGQSISRVDLADVAARVFSGAPAGTEVGGAVSVAAAVATVTLAAAAGLTNFLNGFVLDGLGATAASVIELTITGIIGGTVRYKVTVPAGAGVAIARVAAEYPRPLRATGPNVAIVVSVPSFGAGNTSAVLMAHGFQI